jgi:hypothetical protein
MDGRRRSTGTAIAILVGVVGLAAVSAPAAASRARVDTPETVMVTLRPKAGAEAELARIVASHWAAARRLDLVHGEPHVTLRTRDADGRPVFVDIFTWRDASVPDNAPAEIRTIWNAMNAAVESRAGRPGLEIAEVDLVSLPR